MPRTIDSEADKLAKIKTAAMIGLVAVAIAVAYSAAGFVGLGLLAFGFCLSPALFFLLVFGLVEPWPLNKMGQ